VIYLNCTMMHGLTNLKLNKYIPASSKQRIVCAGRGKGEGGVNTCYNMSLFVQVRTIEIYPFSLYICKSVTLLVEGKLTVPS
jgi:hypothetical protein